MMNGKNILITGGTGSFGKKITEVILRRYKPRRLIIFSRDELKQSELRQKFNDDDYPCMRFFIGDIRDKARLYRAFDDVDIVIHTAALKQVPTAEFNPIEAINTNIIGASNIIDAAIDQNVEKVIVLSTDKAVNPINLYGATKLCADKLFISGNNYVGRRKTRFSIVRYGNVVGSRGSVIPLFLKMRKKGELRITDKQMTRFWITLDQGVNFVLKMLDVMKGGEIFVPKIPSMRIVDLAKAIAPECRLEIIGIRPGEKLHELMITCDDARMTLELEDYYIVLPSFQEWLPKGEKHPAESVGTRCPDRFCYSSDTNNRWLKPEEVLQMIGQLEC